MASATRVRNLVTRETTNIMSQAFYRLDTPLSGQTYVIVTSLRRNGVDDTFIFPANSLGHFTSTTELTGSGRGSSLTDALSRAGYAVG